MERAGSVAALWRYPVKSMLGEQVDSADVAERGLTGDRVFALADAETGKIVSAKRPRLWGRMFELSARWDDDTARITLPDGTQISTADPDADRALSDVLGRKVSIVSTLDGMAMLEEVWIEEKNADPYGPVVGTEGTDRLIEIPASIGAPPGTFFDYAPVHLVTTGTLAALSAAYPEGRFDVRRFRPNVVVEIPENVFTEADWVGRILALGDDVRVEVLTAAPRCVMTTLPQGDLPKDRGILKTVARENPQPFGPFEAQPCVGVYAEVTAPGSIRVGDAVSLV